MKGSPFRAHTNLYGGLLDYTVIKINTHMISRPTTTHICPPLTGIKNNTHITLACTLYSYDLLTLTGIKNNTRIDWGAH